MDGRDQPDTNVVRIRRRGDPSEAERRRLASTIFAEQDDVGTFSRGNLVPPATDHPTEPRERRPSDRRSLLREAATNTRRPWPRARATARSDSETIAYFDQLTTRERCRNGLEGRRAVGRASDARKRPAPRRARAAPRDAARNGRRARTQSRRWGGARPLRRNRFARQHHATRSPGNPRHARRNPRWWRGIRSDPRRPRTTKPAHTEYPDARILRVANVCRSANRVRCRSARSERRRNRRTAKHRPTDSRARTDARRHRARAPPLSSKRSTTTDLTLAADRTPTPSPQTTTTTSAAPPRRSQPAGSGPQQRQQPSSSAAASDQSATPPAGPSGLGQVVGKNCDPKCK